MVDHGHLTPQEVRSRITGTPAFAVSWLKTLDRLLAFRVSCRELNCRETIASLWLHLVVCLFSTCRVAPWFRWSLQLPLKIFVLLLPSLSMMWSVHIIFIYPTWDHWASWIWRKVDIFQFWAPASHSFSLTFSCESLIGFISDLILSSLSFVCNPSSTFPYVAFLCAAFSVIYLCC